MKKNIVIIVLTCLLVFAMYQPTFSVFDLLSIRRYELGISDLSLVQKHYYDLNNDHVINDKDLNIMQETILNY